MACAVILPVFYEEKSDGGKAYYSGPELVGL